MNSKIELRKELEASLASYLSKGKEIKKIPAGHKKPNMTPYQKEKVVEIEADDLPPTLRLKYFGE